MRERAREREKGEESERERESQRKNKDSSLEYRQRTRTNSPPEERYTTHQNKDSTCTSPSIDFCSGNKNFFRP